LSQKILSVNQLENTKMKNLEILGVQEMNTIEMKEQNGGLDWFERVANCVVKDVVKVVTVIVSTPPGPTCPR
jgi:hypothetical protein